MTALTPDLLADLADLRRKAAAAKDINPKEFYPGQSPEALNAHRDGANPAVVLALLDRIEALEHPPREALWSTSCPKCGTRIARPEDANA